MIPKEAQLKEFAPALLAASADAVAVIDDAAMISTCNEQFLNTLGVTYHAARETDAQTLFPEFKLVGDDASLEKDFIPVRMTRPDGAEAWVLMKTIPISRHKHNYRILLIQDPATVRRIVDRLDYIEDHDSSTGLYSRRRGIQELRNLTASEPQGACFISSVKSKSGDIDDRVMVEDILADIIKVYKTLPSFDPVIARLYDNELMFVSTHVEVIAPTYLKELQLQLDKVVADDPEVFIATGIGTWTDNYATSAVQVMDQARLDQLTHERTHTGLDDGAVPHHDFLLELRTALISGQMEFYIQPQISADTRTIIGGELLIRWNHPEEGLVPPGQFIEHLEEGLFAEEFANWSVIEATKVMLELKEQTGDWLRLSLNIAAPQFTPQFTKLLNDSVTFRDIPHEHLEIEITERLLADDPEATLETLRDIRALGFGIAIDDFGTGYSSLSYIRRFPLDRLKIDRAFVVNLAESEEDRLIATAIASLAHVLGLEVIAEGVETPEQASILKSMGCEYFQGYLTGKPMPLAQFVDHLSNSEHLAGWDHEEAIEPFKPVDAGALKQIVWKRSFSTDVASIDDEHRALVDIFNNLTVQLQDPDQEVDLEATLDAIAEEAIKHFEHEERVMENIHYDRLQSHRDKHQALIADFVKRRDELLTAYSDGALEELVNYLKFWLLRHLISEDTRIHRFINRQINDRRE